MVRKLLPLLIMLLAGCVQHYPQVPKFVIAGDGEFSRLADEYLAGYLAWRPQVGTSLGLHQYDGKLTDYSRTSLDAELARLKSFEQRLAQVNTNLLTTQALYDYRILYSAIEREIFGFEQMQIYAQNPMTYSSALDVNIYIKRDFAPLEDRVRSITAILNQAPQLVSAAKANLAESLPRPQVETAIEEANGAADFLSKDLVEALKDGDERDTDGRVQRRQHAGHQRNARLCGLPQGTEAAQSKRPLCPWPGKVCPDAALRRDDHRVTRATAGNRLARTRPQAGGLRRGGPED